MWVSFFRARGLYVNKTVTRGTQYFLTRNYRVALKDIRFFSTNQLFTYRLLCGTSSTKLIVSLIS